MFNLLTLANLVFFCTSPPSDLDKNIIKSSIKVMSLSSSTSKQISQALIMCSGLESQ